MLAATTAGYWMSDAEPFRNEADRRTPLLRQETARREVNAGARKRLSEISPLKELMKRPGEISPLKELMKLEQELASGIARSLR